MKIKFTQGELKKQRDSLKQYERYLPTLQLKKQQIQLEILHQQSIFERLSSCGRRGTFANAYRHPEDISPASRLSVTSHALKE